jgi:hypothetical protein
MTSYCRFGIIYPPLHKWNEPSFVTKPFPDKPDYLVNKDYYNCEGFEKWQTEDSDYMFYDNN